MADSGPGDNRNQKIAFVCVSETVKNTQTESGEQADARTHGRTHLDLLLQEVDFMLLLQKLLLLPSNLGTERTIPCYTVHA